MTALRPIPGASAMGKFAPSPISRQQIALAAAVAATTGPCGIPAAARMAGLAKRMYVMVRKVASAPRAARDGGAARFELEEPVEHRRCVASVAVERNRCANFARTAN